MAARARGAVNLGQGFPDFGWPDDVVAKAAGALTGASSQYPPMRGLPELREAVAAHYRRHQGLALDAEQVIVTSGATEAIAASLLALIDARRRGRAVPAALRRLSAAGAARRRRAAAGPADPARLADHRRGARRRLHPEHPAGPVQQSAQPDRAGVRRGGAGAARRGLRRARTRSRSRTRSGSMSCSTAARTSRSPRCPAWPSARSRSARPARSSR